MWSNEMKSPARRFLILRDADGRVLTIMGDASPQISGGYYVKVTSKWWEKHCKGA